MDSKTLNTLSTLNEAFTKWRPYTSPLRKEQGDLAKRLRVPH